MRISEGELKRLVLSSHSVTQKELNDALKRDDMPLFDALVTLGSITESEIVKLYAKSLGQPYIALEGRIIPPSVLETLHMTLAQKYQAVVFESTQDTAHVAVADPEDTMAIASISNTLGKAVHIFVASSSDVAQIINQYPKSQLVAMPQSVAHSFQQLLEQATRHNATALHLEPQLHQTRVRWRVDDVLHVTTPLVPSLAAAITAHVKRLVNLNPYQHGPSQSEQSTVTVAGNAVSISASIAPTVHGEQLTIRIHANSDKHRALTDLGLSADQLQSIVRSLHHNRGTTLAAGPGASTTLTAIEGYVESSQLTRIDWVGDRASARALAYAATRDSQAIGSLAATDAATALALFTGFAADPLSSAATIKLVMAQRLARKLCVSCRIPYTPAKQERTRLSSHKGTAIYQAGPGCDHCRGIGYKGRIGLFEVLPITQTLRQLVAHNASASEYTEAASAEGMQTLTESALAAVATGVTSFDEIRRLKLY